MTVVDPRDPAVLDWLRDRLFLPMVVAACPAGTTVRVEVDVVRRWSNDWGSWVPGWVSREELDARQVEVRITLVSDRGRDDLRFRLFDLDGTPLSRWVVQEALSEVAGRLDDILPESHVAWGVAAQVHEPAYEWPPDLAPYAGERPPPEAG